MTATAAKQERVVNVFSVRAFLGTLPLPDNIGAAEYRALHEMLTDLDSDDLDGNDIAVVSASLAELADWTKFVGDRLTQYRVARASHIGEDC